MADVCPVCHSAVTQPGLDRSACLNCGAFFQNNSKGESVQVSSTSNADDKDRLKDNTDAELNGDGPAAQQFDVLEPETKGGRGLPVASQPGSTESALVQEGAEPQHGLLPGPGDNVQRDVWDASDGFTVPVMYNERIDHLKAGLLAANNREEEVAASEKAIGREPEIVVKDTEMNAVTLGSPVANKPFDPVDDDTKRVGADKDRKFVSATDMKDADTPRHTPDSLPASKTAKQHGTGEVVPPAGSVKGDVPANDANPAADAHSDPESDERDTSRAPVKKTTKGKR